jgi:hypothetical protein
MFTVDIPPAIMGFLAVHRALRAEASTIETLARTGRTKQARRRAQLLARVLGHHHHAEDELLWPTLLARAPHLAGAMATLEHEHAELDDLLARLPDDLDLAGTVRAFLDDHLMAEEQQALPVWLGAFTSEEHEQFAAALRRRTPLRDTGLMISWLLDHAPEGMAELATGHLPAPLRLLHQVWWRRSYEWRWGTQDSETILGAAYA